VYAKPIWISNADGVLLIHLNHALTRTSNRTQRHNVAVNMTYSKHIMTWTLNDHKQSLTTSLQMLRVQVAPVGFEVDRMAMRSVEMKGDRVWIIHT
jgi:hypothetical protein